MSDDGWIGKARSRLRGGVPGKWDESKHPRAGDGKFGSGPGKPGKPGTGQKGGGRPWGERKGEIADRRNPARVVGGPKVAPRRDGKGAALVGERRGPPKMRPDPTVGAGKGPMTQSERAEAPVGPAGLKWHGIDPPEAPDDQIVRTADVDEALDALVNGKRVEFEHVSQVSTLLDRIRTIVAEIDAEAKANGEKAKFPDYDLCLVTVKKTNLFCSEHKDFGRAEMPQFSGQPVPGSPADDGDRFPKNPKNGEVDLSAAFIEHLMSKGIEIEETEVLASHLKATQRELIGGKVAGMAGAVKASVDAKSGKFTHPVATEAIFVSQDDYVIDGHHRWAAMVGIDAEDDNLDTYTMPVRRIKGMTVLDVLAESIAWTTEMGVPPKKAKGGDLNKAMVPSSFVTPDGDEVWLAPFSMELLGDLTLSVSTPDGTALLDVQKADCPSCAGDGFEVVTTDDGEGGVLFDVDGSRVLWAPLAKSFGAESVGCDLVFTDGDEVSFPAGFEGTPWPASDAGMLFVRPDQGTDVVKAAAGPPTEVRPEDRYTLGPLYPATPGGRALTADDLDAHEEFVTDDDLQKSVWDYTRSGDRTIRLQHGNQLIGEWVELMCIPGPVTVDLALPTGETVTKSFAEGTPFMGVIWNPVGWELVKKGKIRGYSFGGSAQKMTVDVA